MDILLDLLYIVVLGECIFSNNNDYEYPVSRARKCRLWERVRGC